MPGAKLTTTGPSSRLGSGGTGLITQTGGEVIFGQHLTIADYAPGSGTYDLQAGSVSVNGGYFTVGMRGAGYFNVSGTSTLTVNTGFYVGSSHVDNGGDGTFTQDGGTVSAYRGLTLGLHAGTSGVYHLNSGTLNVTGNIVDDAGSGTMNIDGGVLNLLTSSAAAGFDTLRIGNAGSTTGSLTVTGSQAFTIADLIVGNEGAGAITHNSGTVTATTLSLASQSGSSGAYTLNGGTLTVTGDITDSAGEQADHRRRLARFGRKCDHGRYLVDWRSGGPDRFADLIGNRDGYRDRARSWRTQWQHGAAEHWR